MYVNNILNTGDIDIMTLYDRHICPIDSPNIGLSNWNVERTSPSASPRQVAWAISQRDRFVGQLFPCSSLKERLIPIKIDITLWYKSTVSMAMFNRKLLVYQRVLSSIDPKSWRSESIGKKKHDFQDGSRSPAQRRLASLVAVLSEDAGGPGRIPLIFGENELDQRVL